MVMLQVCFILYIANVVWIVGLVRMADRVMKTVRNSIENIGVPGNEVVPDAVNDHDDSGELHTKTGTYTVVHGMSTYMGSDAVYTYSWSDDSLAEGRLLRARCSSAPLPASPR